MSNNKHTPVMTLKQARRIVEDEFGLDISERNRKRDWVAARTVYYLLCHKLCSGKDRSYQEFASYIGRHHASVVNAFKKHSDDVETGAWEYSQEYERCHARATLLVNINELVLIQEFQSVKEIVSTFRSQMVRLLAEFDFALSKYDEFKKQHEK